MTFLNAALLAGMAALAIPIIIHLFHKSRFRVVDWGAMHLLEAVIRVNRRRVRLEQLILLLIRCAIPVLLALVMARPIWRGSQKLIGGVPSSTVLLVDNSYSMEASRAGLSNIAIARDEASRLLNELKRGSDAAVILMGETATPLLDKPTYDLARLSQAVQKLTAGYGTAAVPAALDYAAGFFGQMHEPFRNLVLFTDFQRVSFEPGEKPLFAQTLARLTNLPLPPSIIFFDVGSEVKENVAVESLDFSRLMVGVGQKIQLRANLRNYGRAVYPDLRVYFKVDGKEKSVSTIALGAEEKGQVLFSHAFDAAGSHVVEVYAEADALRADNVFRASIPVRDKVPVLLVNGDPNSDALRGETDFAEIALQPYSAGKVELADLITTRVIKPEELEAKMLSDAAVAIVANVRRLNDGQLRTLEEFVRNGGGLLLFTGNRVDPAWWNEMLFNDGRGLLPLPLDALAGELNERSRSAAIVSQRFDNPALELFNDPRNGTLSDSAVKVWFKMKEKGNASAAAATTLARLETGDPFLVEKAFGNGRVILCATALDADWGNLPMRPFYLPLVQRLTVYLASTIYPPRNLEPGKPIVAFLPVSEAGKKVALVTADELTIDVPVIKKGERGVVEFAHTERPGLYTVRPRGGEPLHYAVNASRRESDLQKLGDNEISELAKEHGVTVVHNSTEYRALDQTRRYGRDIWKPLLWLLLGVVFMEMVVEQRFARARGKS